MTGFIANATCDIYRNGNAPPAAPDVSAVSCSLEAIQHDRPLTDIMQTHTLIVDVNVDIRENFPTTQGGTGGDNVYVPDQSGVRYLVCLVKRKNQGLANDQKLCFLRRQTVSWPNNNV